MPLELFHSAGKTKPDCFIRDISNGKIFSSCFPTRMSQRTEQDKGVRFVSLALPPALDALRTSEKQQPQDTLEELKKRLEDQNLVLARLHAQLRDEIQARKQIEIALHESEERFMLFMNHSPLITFIKDENGNYVYGNKRWQMTFGKDWTERKSCTDYDLYPREIAGHIRREDLEILSTGKNLETIRTYTGNGKQTNSWLTVRFPYFDPRGRPFVGGVALDITERKWAAAKLKAHAIQQAAIARFGQQALTGASPQCLMDEAAMLVSTTLDVEFCAIMELDARERSLRARSIGPIRKLRVGFPPLEAGNRSQAAYVLRKRKPVLIRNLPKETRFEPSPFLLKQNLLSGMEVIIPKGKGVWGILSTYSRRKRHFSKGEMHFVQAVANTLAAAIERKEAEWALRHSEATLTDFFDNAPVGLHWLGPDGRILRANKAELEMLGYKGDEYVGHHISQFHVEKELIKDVLAKLPTNRIQNYEARIICKNGTIKNVVIDLNVFWEEGRFIHARCFSRDVTEQRQREKQVLEISEREQHRIGQDLHDELCQYLAAIKFKSGLLQRKLAQARYAHAREAGVIETMLNRSIHQAHSLARGLCPVQVEVGGLVSALKELATHMTTIYGCNCHCKAGKISFIRDATVAIHLYRIAQEATTNAIKHGKAARVDIGILERGAELILSVEDNGLGFSKQVPNKNGMGLHLMSYRARIIGATIDIRAKPGGGTVLTCTLPYRPASQRNAK
jgi:two-component system, LuxR family, sensor kinase FixL